MTKQIYQCELPDSVVKTPRLILREQKDIFRAFEILYLENFKIVVREEVFLKLIVGNQELESLG